jgi:NAD(P)H-hydrate epimerase
VVCGPGNNGGDGLAAARHLANAGRDLRIHLVAPAGTCRPGSDAATNLAIVRAMGIPIIGNVALDGAAVVIDAIFGTGLREAVRDPYRAAITAVRASRAGVVAIDLPSGLDADTGAVLGVSVRADLTATMLAPKVGFTRGQGPSLVGEVVVVDIGVPPSLLRRVTGE